MKTLFSILFVLFVTISNAQTNYQQSGNTLTEIKIPATKESLTKNSTLTGYTFIATDKKSYPVYQSVNGKLFIVRTSKTGTFYKQYLKNL